MQHHLSVSNSRKLSQLDTFKYLNVSLEKTGMRQQFLSSSNNVGCSKTLITVRVQEEV